MSRDIRIAWLLFATVSVAGVMACAAAKSEAAEGTYLGQQLSCVDRNETRAAIDACRNEVKAKWGRLDAGADHD